MKLGINVSEVGNPDLFPQCNQKHENVEIDFQIKYSSTGHRIPPVITERHLEYVKNLLIYAAILTGGIAFGYILGRSDV